jgi:hypothetical protein
MNANTTLIRAWNKFFDAAQALGRYATDLEETDKNEGGALWGVIEQNIAPTVNSFSEIFERLESGEAVSFQIGINDKPAVVRGNEAE